MRLWSDMLRSGVLSQLVSNGLFDIIKVLCDLNIIGLRELVLLKLVFYLKFPDKAREIEQKLDAIIHDINPNLILHGRD